MKFLVLKMNSNRKIKLVEFFENHLDKVYWPYLCQNKNIPVEFFEENLDKVHWGHLCKNTNIPVEFFEKHLNKIDWGALSTNNFSNYFYNFEIQENKKILSVVHDEIDTLCLVPSNSFSFLSKGGYGYIKVLDKYNF